MGLFLVHYNNIFKKILKKVKNLCFFGIIEIESLEKDGF